MYIKLSTLEFPRYEGDIRLEHPEILETQTGDNFPCPSTYAKVIETTPPQIDANQRLVFGPPKLSDAGIWETTWQVLTLSQQELEELARLNDQLDGSTGI